MLSKWNLKKIYVTFFLLVSWLPTISAIYSSKTQLFISSVFQDVDW